MEKITLPIAKAAELQLGEEFTEAIASLEKSGEKEVTLIGFVKEDGKWELGIPKPTTPVEELNKSIETVEEDRYTLAPFYLPNTLDAHGEHTDTREIEKAFWAYMGKEDNQIRLQHNTAIVAGHRVDGVVWPLEVTVPLTKADGTQTMHTFPAGTPWLGTKWEPWAWELIQAGKIRGYSMGGSATMLEVNLEGGKEAYDASTAQ